MSQTVNHNVAAAETVLRLLEAVQRQHQGEDIAADLAAMLDPLDADPELAGAAIAQAVWLLFVAVTNVARLRSASYRSAVEEFRTFVEAGYQIEDENTARLRHLERTRDPENVRPTPMWPTKERSNT